MMISVQAADMVCQKENFRRSMMQLIYSKCVQLSMLVLKVGRDRRGPITGRATGWVEGLASRYFCTQSPESRILHTADTQRQLATEGSRTLRLLIDLY